jgi:Bifunctional DNA primase/polymerase, N-terminal
MSRSSRIFKRPSQDSAELLGHALTLADRGWTLIPTLPGSKAAAVAWKSFQCVRPTQCDLEQWFGPGGIAGGIAVVLGKASGNLACRDFDDQDVYDRWARGFPDLATRLPTVQTHRGRHVYFVGPSGFEDLGDGEYRGTVRQYCLVPPSLHPMGGCYRWLVPLPPGDLPVIADPFSAGLIYHPLTSCNTENTENSGGIGGGEGGSAPSVFSVLHEPTDKVERAILVTLPTGEGQRHRAVFKLAQQLKALPHLADADVIDLKPIVWRFHQRALPVIRTKPFEETWLEFAEAWPRVKFPAGRGPLEVLWSRALAEAPPPAALGYGLEGIRRLVALCSQLQRHAGQGTFFLACRTAGSLLNVVHTTAWRWLRLLEIEGVLRRVTTGSKVTRRANEYRYLG